MFLIAVIVIAIISVLWAFWSLRGFYKDKKAIKNVKKDLEKGRVVFQK